MKQELQMKTELRERLEYLIDILIETIVRLEDYAIYKQIKLSEGVLFIIAMFRAVWFLCFGVQNANYDYFFSDLFWIVVFWLMTLVHLAGFLTPRLEFNFRKILINSKKLRIAAIYIHAFVWLFLTVLALISRTSAPAVPMLGVLFVFSIIVIVRLSGENIADD